MLDGYESAPLSYVYSWTSDLAVFMWYYRPRTETCEKEAIAFLLHSNSYRSFRAECLFQRARIDEKEISSKHTDFLCHPEGVYA